MKIECPACSASGNVDESKIPKEGRQVSCPRCAHRFLVLPERSAVEIIQKREKMVCPKCHCEQPVSEQCIVCGIGVKKYIQSQALHQDKERLEVLKLRAETRSVNDWYANLFDRRLTTLLVRVLSLLFLGGLFVTCSLNNAMRNKYYSEGHPNKNATDVSARSNNREASDPAFKEKFNPVVAALSDGTDRCMAQCNNYLITWYQRDIREHYLTDFMAGELETIKKDKIELKTLFGSLPDPSKQYHDCYGKAVRLNTLYESIYSYAVGYKTHYFDFDQKISAFNHEYVKLRGELNACSDSIK